MLAMMMDEFIGRMAVLLPDRVVITVCYLSREGNDDRDDIKLMISLSDVVSGTILLALSLQQERTSVRGIGDERALSSSS